MYAELRGRPFKGPGKPLHFVGRIPNLAAQLLGRLEEADDSFGPDTFLERLHAVRPWPRLDVGSP